MECQLVLQHHRPDVITANMRQDEVLTHLWIYMRKAHTTQLEIGKEHSIIDMAHRIKIAESDVDVQGEYLVVLSH